MELTPRLQRVADWVQPGVRLADVGTDHAYLPVWLRLQGKVPYAIASDLRKGPLERAKETGRIYGVDGVDFRLCSGLADIRPEEVDTITICGMGGETICSILEAAPWTADGRHTLLLEPQSHVDRLRLFLSRHGYRIVRECLVLDRGTMYPVMEVAAGQETLSLGQLWGGAKLLRDPLGDRYLIETILRLQTAVAGWNRSGKPERADETREIITALLEMREEWRHANCQRN